MKNMSEKSKSWNEVIKDCFAIFDRVCAHLEATIFACAYFQNETGSITRKDFEYILRELGNIDNSNLLGERRRQPATAISQSVVRARIL